jgi:UDP-glucose 4-epimerase
MNVLVTGSQGYLGMMVSKSMADSGLNVRSLGLSIPGKIPKGYENIDFRAGDITSEGDMMSACDKIDVVIHLAAMDREACSKNPEMAAKVNGLGTKNVLSASKARKVKLLIYISSIHVYGSPSGIVDESTATSPKDDYAATKLLGEKYCLMDWEGLNTAILRLSNVFGHSESGKGKNLLVNDLCLQCFSSRKMVLKTSGLQKRNFVSINDVIGAIRIIMDAPDEKINRKIFNVGGSETLSVIDITRKVAQVYEKMYDKKPEIIVSSQSPAHHDFVLNFDAIKMLGYKPGQKIDGEIENIFTAIEKGGYR